MNERKMSVSKKWETKVKNFTCISNLELVTFLHSLVEIDSKLQDKMKRKEI